MSRHRHLAAVIAVAVLVAAGHASADPKHSDTKRIDAYTYTFLDDPLDAGYFGPNDTRCFGTIRAMRATLIRPRTAFVVELVKTVEHL